MVPVDLSNSSASTGAGSSRRRVPPRSPGPHSGRWGFALAAEAHRFTQGEIEVPVLSDGHLVLPVGSSARRRRRRSSRRC